MQVNYKQLPIAHDDYAARIKALVSYARSDGYDLRTQSKEDFWRFVESEPQIRRGNLVLIDNGNLRLTWKDEEGTQLGLQFLGNGVVQYVITKELSNQENEVYVTGRDSLSELKHYFESYQLDSLFVE